MLRGHAPAAKRDAFEFQTGALFERRAHAKLDLAADAGDPLPGQGIAALAEYLRDQAVMERIACGGGYRGVGGGPALGDEKYDADDGGVALVVGPLKLTRQGPFELVPGEHYTPQQ
jgi:hypothetical protein